VPDDKGCRIFITSGDLRDIRQLEALLADHDRGIADLINVGESPVEADKHLCPIRINRPCRSHRILSRESGKDIRWRDAQHRQTRIGKLDEYSFLLFPHDIHLLDSRHVEKSLPEFFGDAGQFSERKTGSLHRVECE
jgi:hypothetical protein